MGILWSGNLSVRFPVRVYVFVTPSHRAHPLSRARTADDFTLGGTYLESVYCLPHSVTYF